MNFSASSLIAGLTFGAVGLYFLRVGKRDANIARALLGIALMGYPYFVESNYALWGIGAALWLTAYKAQ